MYLEMLWRECRIYLFGLVGFHVESKIHFILWHKLPRNVIIRTPEYSVFARPQFRGIQNAPPSLGPKHKSSRHWWCHDRTGKDTFSCDSDGVWVRVWGTSLSLRQTFLHARGKVGLSYAAGNSGPKSEPCNLTQARSPASSKHIWQRFCKRARVNKHLSWA